MLDAARKLVLDRGVGAATVAEIARSSGAPTGSIYHRFDSVDELLGQMWVRAVRRSQAQFALAAKHPEPVEAAVAAALSIYDFALDNPGDARLLLSLRREDLVHQALPGDLGEELADLNEPIKAALADLARRHYGRATPANVDAMGLAVVDLPMGALRRPLMAGQKPRERNRHAVGAAVRAALLA